MNALLQGKKEAGISEALSCTAPEGGEVAGEQRLGSGPQQGPQHLVPCSLLDATLSFTVTRLSGCENDPRQKGRCHRRDFPQKSAGLRRPLGSSDRAEGKSSPHDTRELLLAKYSCYVQNQSAACCTFLQMGN